MEQHLGQYILEIRPDETPAGSQASVAFQLPPRRSLLLGRSDLRVCLPTHFLFFNNLQKAHKMFQSFLQVFLECDSSLGNEFIWNDWMLSLAFTPVGSAPLDQCLSCWCAAVHTAVRNREPEVL